MPFCFLFHAFGIFCDTQQNGMAMKCSSRHYFLEVQKMETEVMLVGSISESAIMPLSFNKISTTWLCHALLKKLNT